MRRFCIGLLYAIAAYAVVGAASYFLVMQLSGNTHDREVEAGMTSVFFFGPLGAIIAFIVGVVRGGRPRATRTND